MEKSEPITISSVITFDEESYPQAVSVSNYGGMPSSAVRAVAQEALDNYYGLTALRHGFVPETHPADTINEDGTETMVFEILNTNKY